VTLKKEELSLLRPYLEGETAGEDGEWGMRCPIHDDTRRSASLNVNKRKWHCMACEEGGPLNDLLWRLKLQREESAGGAIGQFEEEGEDDSSKPIITEGAVVGWHSALLSRPTELNNLLSRRGLETRTVVDHQIGWDMESRAGKGAYTIPIRTQQGAISNVRRYTLDPVGDRRKIWSVKGLGSPSIYPVSALDGEDDIIICEGELDALVTIQHGFCAVTRTGSATTWREKWNHHFDGKRVFLCHDMDTAGREGNKKVALALKGVAREVRIIDLPYEVTEKHGKDLTDFFLDGYTAADLKDLMGELEPVSVKEEIEVRDSDIKVLDSFDAGNAGHRLRLRVTITGKHNPPFLVPADVDFECGMDAGAKCNFCVMQEVGGSSKRTIYPDDPRILDMLSVPTAKVHDVLREILGAQKCGVMKTHVTKRMSVEEIFVRPSVEQSQSQGEAGDYTSRKIISVGRHDSMANSTVSIVGSIHPNPKLQHNELMAWEVVKTETSIDRYQVTAEGMALMDKFKPVGMSPIRKLGVIARDLSANVTKIYGRHEMHAMMDLVYHSVLSFPFMGDVIGRGWVEGLVIGDTRTGKSEVAERLRQHYGMGEMVSCESASFAGIVGGLTQQSGKEWEINWGAIPINDRRLVILDEVSGMGTEQIAQMSSIRSSGEAQLTKIRSERTFARTRLIWLGNPRNGRMSEYTYGVQAIRPLIGNNEDIARFDIAMSVYAEEVSSEAINSVHPSEQRQIYDKESCQELVTWVWSRHAEHVAWGTGAEQEVLRLALDLGGRYVESPPLVQAANIRIKLARIAVAIAARTYSTDESGELVVVTKAHVRAAVKFLDMLYGMRLFGYQDLSREHLEDERIARENKDEAKGFMVRHVGLSRLLRDNRQFRSNDLQDMLSIDRDTANDIIKALSKMRMIKRENANIKVQRVLHEILRDVKD